MGNWEFQTDSSDCTVGNSAVMQMRCGSVTAVANEAEARGGLEAELSH